MKKMSPGATISGASRASCTAKNLVHKNDVIIQWRVLPVKDARLEPKVVARGHIYSILLHMSHDMCNSIDAYWSDDGNKYKANASIAFPFVLGKWQQEWQFQFLLGQIAISFSTTCSRVCNHTIDIKTICVPARRLQAQVARLWLAKHVTV